MAKSKKKRDKKYRGVDAKTADNVVRVHKLAAVPRSDRAQWLHDHRSLLTKIAIGVAIAAIVIFLIVNGIMSASK